MDVGPDLGGPLVFLIMLIASNLALFGLGYVKFQNPPRFRRKGIPLKRVRKEGLWTMVFAVSLPATYSVFLIFRFAFSTINWVGIILTWAFWGVFIFVFTGVLCFYDLRARVGKKLAGRTEGIIFIIIGGILLILGVYFSFIL